MEGGLSPQLQAKLNDWSAAQPYVWQLRLSESDFKELEATITHQLKADNGRHETLLSEHWALAVLLYMAEWYKRCYQSGNTNDLLQLDTNELKQLWQTLGINTLLYLYTDASGNSRWQYSTYVLGGLAIRHELNRKESDNGRFLKGLCRIFNGENYTLENLDDATRAVAFRESIRQKHSLYVYLQEILSGQLPFSEDDLQDGQSEVNRFILAIKTANDEVLRQKFRFEWIVYNAPDGDTMQRRLRVWMNPEEVGGGQHHYLRYDRVHLWGFIHPEKVEHLRVSIQFFDGDKVVSPCNFDEPLLVYTNTGAAETGFVCWNTSQYKTFDKVPVRHFSEFQLVVRDNSGETHVAQEQVASEYLQLWRMGQWDDWWSSLQNSQRQTAIVFSRRCRLVGSGCEEVSYKPFHEKGQGSGEIYGWHYIYDCATLKDEHDREQTFYNRQGYDMVTTRLYNDTISYKNGGLVSYYSIGDPEEDDELSEKQLPLIFGKSDIIVRHFNTKDDVKNAQPDSDTTPEQVEWRLDNGRYNEWPESERPKYGEVTLRVTSKGVQNLITVLYLPPLSETATVERNLKQNTITYRDWKSGQPRSVTDVPPLDGKPLAPTVEIRFGDEQSYAVLDIWRPVQLHEVCLGDRVVKYGCGETTTIPYILKDELTYNEFGHQGYRSYKCSMLGSIYPLLPDQRDAHMEAWRTGQEFEATRLDAEAPQSLRITFGTAEDEVNDDERLTFLLWDYDKDKDPGKTYYHVQEERNTILFQSLKDVNEGLIVAYAHSNFFPFSYRDVQQRTSALSCFEVAAEHRLYFFAMKPLTMLNTEEFAGQVYHPLLEKRGNRLTDNDRRALCRLADEFQFNWADMGIEI